MSNPFKKQMNDIPFFIYGIWAQMYVVKWRVENQV